MKHRAAPCEQCGSRGRITVGGCLVCAHCGAVPHPGPAVSAELEDPAGRPIDAIDVTSLVLEWIEAGATTLTARPMRQEFHGRVVIHAAADRQSSIGMGYAPGEALCGSLAELAECEPGLFPPSVTCQRCLSIAAAEHVEITGGAV